MKPYKCPVCEGKGMVPGGFYLESGKYTLSNTTAETCRSCGGTGVIWGSAEEPQHELPEGVNGC